MISISCPSPNCGHKLMEGEYGSCVQVKCHKCGSIIRVELKPDETVLKVIAAKTTSPIFKSACLI